ncbi:MAG: hypothetical protein E7160_01420 [Firmicutes bacterium]|nr:hypothetical protein [Bacillota bacterium]
MIYKVKVYKIEDKLDKRSFVFPKITDERRNFEYVDDIIVEKRKDTEKELYREIYTDYELNILSESDILTEGLLKPKSINYRKLRDDKIVFFTFKENIDQKVDVSTLELDEYFTNFFDGKYKKLYDKYFNQEKTYVKIK